MKKTLLLASLCLGLAVAPSVSFAQQEETPPAAAESAAADDTKTEVKKK